MFLPYNNLENGNEFINIYLSLSLSFLSLSLSFSLSLSLSLSHSLNFTKRDSNAKNDEREKNLYDVKGFVLTRLRLAQKYLGHGEKHFQVTRTIK